MRFIVVSGLSGSGKSSALNLLEDEGFVCIDNLPITLLPGLIEQTLVQKTHHSGLAVGIDARNPDTEFATAERILIELKAKYDQFEIVYLESSSAILLKRYSETRRRHPLSNDNVTLEDAITKEQQTLKPISELADVFIDSSALTIHQLRSLLKQRVLGSQTLGTSLTFSSFGFKFGTPMDADFIFDVRCLPNPHWDERLRDFTGKDEPVIHFLEREKDVQAMFEDIKNFITSWLPKFENNNRSYLNVAIGCTGGKHRSVFLAEKLCAHFGETRKGVQVKHKQLENENIELKRA